MQWTAGFNTVSRIRKIPGSFRGVQEVYNLAVPTNKHSFEQHVYHTLLANSYVVRNTLELAKQYQAKYPRFVIGCMATQLTARIILGRLLGLYWHHGPRSCYNEASACWNFYL